MIPHSAISAALSELPESVLQIDVIRPVIRVVGKSETSTVEILQGREQLAIRVLAQPARYVNPMIRIDSNKVRVERDVVQRRHADSVLHRRGPSILVGSDVRPYQ